MHIFVVRIECDSAAFDDDPEVHKDGLGTLPGLGRAEECARILRGLAEDITMCPLPGQRWTLRDHNGKSVGYCQFK